MNRILSRAVVAALFVGFSNAQVLADDVPVQRDSVEVTVYDGIADDLLSAGLNLAGLVSAVPPAFADPNNPTAAELRRRAVYNNYRAIVDPVPAGGMGLLWGPGSAGSPVFAAPVVPGLIPGVEYKAYLQAPSHHPHVNNIPAAVQIPRALQSGQAVHRRRIALGLAQPLRRALRSPNGRSSRAARSRCRARAPTRGFTCSTLRQARSRSTTSTAWQDRSMPWAMTRSSHCATRAGSMPTSRPIRTASRPSMRIRRSTPSACGASSRSRASSSRSGP